MSEDSLLDVTRTPSGWLVIDLAPIGGNALVWDEKLHIPDEFVELFQASVLCNR